MAKSYFHVISLSLQRDARELEHVHVRCLDLQEREAGELPKVAM